MADVLGSVLVEILGDPDPFADDFIDSLSDAGIEGGAAMAGGIESGLDDLDLDIDASDAFDSLEAEASAAASGVVDAFDDVASEIEASLDGISLDGLREGIEENLAAITVGFGAAGAGAEGFARSQQDSTLSLQRMGDRLDMEEKELRKFIDGLTDWTFSSADAAAGMEFLSQRGVDNLDTIEKLLPAWDDFADATGQDFVQAMESGSRALGVFGIPAEDAADHMDTLTFLTNELGVDLDLLGRQLISNVDDLEDLGLSLDDTAGLMAGLQAQGLSSRDAMRVLREGLSEADGDMGALLDTLGMTEAEFNEYQDAVAGAAGLTAHQADQANALATPMQRLGGFAQNLAFRFGGVGRAAGIMAAPLGAVGPALFGITQVGGVAAKVLPALGGGLRAVAGAFRTLSVAILTNPIFLIAAVLIGIVAVIWYFRDEIMAGLTAAWDWVRDVTGGALDWLREAIPNAINAVVEWFSELPGRVLDAITDFAVRVMEFIDRYHPVAILWRAVQRVWPSVMGWLRDLPGRIITGLAGLTIRVVTWLDRYNPVAILLRAVRAAWPAVLSWLRERPGVIIGIWRTMIDSVRGVGRDLIIGLWNGIRSMGTWLRDKIVGFVADRIPGPIARALGLSSPSKLMAGFGRDIVRGLVAGIDETADEAVAAAAGLSADLAGAVDTDPLTISMDTVRPEGLPAPTGFAPVPTGPLVGEMNIYTTEPKRAGDEVLRSLRDRAFLNTPIETGRVA